MRISLAVLAVASAALALAQPPASSPITAVTSAPAGTCSGNQGRLVGPGGIIYTCQGGTWQAATSSGAPGTVTSVAPSSCLKSTPNPIVTTGTIAIDGAVNPQTTTYQVLAGDFSACKTITVASGTFTITLVASGSQPAAGQSISILNYGSGTVTVARSGQNINGGTASLTIGPGSAANPSGGSVKSDGTDYFALVGSSFPATTCTNQFIRSLAAGTAAGTCASVAAASDVTGTLPVANGGTGITALGTGVATALGVNVSGSGAICLASGSACSSSASSAVSNITPVTVSANSTSAQVLQQLTIPAALFNISGAPFTYNASGIYTAAALQTPTLTYTVNLCTVSGCGSGTVRALAVIVTPAVVTATNNVWNIRLTISTTATGATGTVLAHGTAIVELTAASDLGTPSSDSNTASSGTIDLTAGLFIQLTVTTSTGNAGNSITNDKSSLEPASAQGATGATGAAGSSGQTLSGNCGGVINTGSGPIAVNGFGGAASNGSCTQGNTFSYLGTIVNVPAGCTLKNLYVNNVNNGANAGDGAITIWRNAGATTLTCTIGTASACNDTTHTEVASAGDLVWLKGTSTSGNLASLAVSLSCQ